MSTHKSQEKGMKAANKETQIFMYVIGFIATMLLIAMQL